MSEIDVNLIRDEDVLRRMWQQTEDFGRKKEIRAHMYRLREERLRSLYSPDPTPTPTRAKGCEFSSSQAHVDSFADQTFQSMKSKEVRDAGSPPKEFSYRGQDQNELSNAGWTVESEDCAADKGRTRVQSQNANIEGSFHVEGGRGQFVASDRQRRAVTETEDAHGHTRREDTSAASARTDHVERRATDGSQHSSSISSSTTQHHSQQVSSTVQEASAIQDYDQTHDSNRNETITRNTNTERTLRSDDVTSGELVSRKIDYPDDRTKVIVETRCLPDGTRVTNTRREFRAPAHTAHSEYQTSSEIKSHSSQLKSDTREMSSKTTRHTTAGRIDDNIQDFRRTTDDIVDSQRHVDDNDFKRQLREYTIDDDTASELHRKNRRHETTSRKVTDHSQTNENFSRTHYETNVNNKVTDRSSKTRDVKDDYTQFHQQTTQRFVDNVDQTDRREVDDDSNISYKNIRESHTAKDRLRDSPRDGERPGPTPDDTTRNNNSYPNPKDNTELIHTITEVTDEKNNNRQVQDTKVEEVVERKISSDRYQTTYQSDFPQKKVSTDWSPTQQAWASSLRADTPPATRPSTRASSPGSKTFKSSTSSLRSSVSPDKYRKTPSRGPSPSKLDRCSPTHSVISDKVSSTRHSFFSINETTTNKHASPERKPPIGRAPGYHSPERNPESGRQRPSVSPEKRLQNLSSRPSVSPDRKPSNKALTNEYLRNTSPTRAAGIPSGARQSPDRQTHTGYPSPSSPQNSRSPERQLRTDISKSRTSTSPDRKRPIEYTNKPKGSPEREVGYRHPTPTNDPTKLNKQSVSPDRKPGYMRPTAASQHALGPSKPEDGPEKSSPSSDPMHSTSTMVREDHYKFIDEETKMNTRTDKIYDMHQGKATSPKKSPSKDSVLPLSNRRSPSPQKKIVIVNENDELYGKVDKTVELIDTTDTQTENVETKFGTYDKQKPRDITETTVITTSSPTKDVTYDTLRPRDKTSPKRGQEPTSPIKKSPKGSTSPTKSPTREARFKQTTDFINSEKTTEEINKKTISKEHPRQLVTPSSSPTRKPKFVEEEPSTGQSSPTTSVSGFVYFGSPREEKPIVTDLDEDFLPGTDTSNEPQYPRPESLNLLRSTSPSKIPCRSPSPEKRDSLTKDSFPRKSSLKKPSTFVNPSSPVDKPPTSFRISPTEDEPSLHKVVKKDYPSEPETTTPTRAKPPLTRRETYEDRCRLILGMMDTNTSECIKKTTPKSKKPDSNKSSPSVSPCDSPLHKEPSLFSDFSTEDKVVNTKSDVTSFISREQQDIIQTIKVNRGDKITETKTLQKSPEKESRSPSKSPERKTGGTSENNSSSIKLPHPSFSPQRTEPLPVRDSPDKILSGKRPKETSPTRTIKKTTYDETTTTENATSVDKNYLEEFTTSTKIRTRVLASPTRQTPKSSPAGQLTKPRHDGSPSRDTQSPQRTSERKPQESRTAKTLQDQSSEQTVSHKSRESPEKIASSIKCDTTAITEDHEEIYTSKTVDRKITKTSVCPTLPIEKSSPRSISPTKPSHPRNNVPKSDLSPDRKTFNLEYTKTTASSMEKEKPTSLKATDQKQTTSQYSESPKRKTSEPRTPSPIKSTRQPSATFTKKADTSPDRKPASKQPSSAKDDVTKKSQSQSPSRKPVNKLTEFTNTSTTVSSEHETNEYCNITTEDTQKKTTSTTGSILYPRKSPIHDSFKPIDKSSHEYPRSGSPTKPTEETPKRPEISPEHRSKPANESPYKLIPKKPEDKSTNTSKSSVSPDRKPSYMKSTASVSSKQGSNIKQDITLDSSTHKQSSTKSSTPQESQGTTPKDTHTKPEEPRQLRTPSPTKKNIKVTEVSTDLLMSEREQEILDRVQKSLRKLSPERKEKSPSRDKSPNKNTSSLQDLDITTTKSVKLDIGEKNYVKESCPEEPTKEMQEMPNKPSSRNTSPVKRTSSVLTSPNKSRSISPRKPLSQTDRPQSPRGARASGVRPRDQVPFNRKPTPANLSTYKIDNVTNGVIKQNVISKTNTTSKITTNRLVSPSKPNEPEIKRNATIKGIKENNKSPRKEVTRTSSDSNIKPKKAPQRMKSKPEIQVNDLSTKSPKYQKPIIKEPSKMPVKPKSATALNTPDNDDDIIIDVQQSKSSRENSPDRICPTPVNFTDDVGTPRFPDEVNEPDDEYCKRTYHTIHETETIVDDIVEICEDEELFVKKSDITSEYDDSLLSVTDKVNKFTTKIDSITKPKDASNIFKMNEQRGHSDLINDNLKTDESLLTVSEKVTKFVKGSGETKDNPSKFRKITDEYDNDTIYQDDYTKLSVNDKAHLFVETAENMKVSKAKPAQKVERPDLSNVDESLKKDDCLLSVSDKVNKFVKTAESFITETHEVDQKERKHKEQHDREDTNETYECNELTVNNSTNNDYDQPKAVKQETIPESNLKNSGTSKTNPADRMPTVKITTLRSSAAVKKAKELFENIASTQKKDASQNKVKTTKLTDIGVVKKSPKTDSTTVLHPSVEDVTPFLTETAGENDACPYSPNSYERPSSGTFYTTRVDDKPRASPNRLTANSLEILRTKSPARQSKSPASQSKSPMRQTVETTGTTARTVLSRYPVAQNAENPRDRAKSPRVRPEPEKPDKVPGYLKPTKTSQNKEESKVEEDVEVSTRRGSGKFGVELRRTSLERSTISSERRRSVEHHQPCIEDIVELDLLEQMLEKVMGYEQRRRIRSQIRIVKNQSNHVETHKYVKTNHTTSSPRPRLPDQQTTRSPDRGSKQAAQRMSSPDRRNKTTLKKQPERAQPAELIVNGDAKEPPPKSASASLLRTHSPEKLASKSIHSAKSPIRQSSPVKKRTVSPTKNVSAQRANRFNEYATAYMKKVDSNQMNKVKLVEKKTKKTTDTKQTFSHETQDRTSQEFTTTNSFSVKSERTPSRDVIEILQTNGKRSPSPKKETGVWPKPQSPERRVYSPAGKTVSPERAVHSPVSKAPERKVNSPISKISERKPQSPERNRYSPIRKSSESERRTVSPERKVTSPAERLYQRSPSPEFKRQRPDPKKETIIKVYEIEKKIPSKPVQDVKPSWVTNRNLKKITSETRTFNSKKPESEKPKYLGSSPSMAVCSPTDVITSSYGPGPLDAAGRPLFGIRALRNGASTVHVKGTVIRQEFHSSNGSAPEGTMSVTAYSSQPEQLERLLAGQKGSPPSRVHGLAAITTTKKFGGDTGISMSSVNTKEERASLDQFTHIDRKTDSRIESLHSHNFETQENIDDMQRIASRKTNSSDRQEKRREERVTEVRKGDKAERREDKKTVRQSSVKSLTEKFIKSAHETGKAERGSYPKAGLILRTTSVLRDADDTPPGLGRADSEQSIGSTEDVVVSTSSDRGVTTTTRTSRHHGPTTTHQRTTTVTHHKPLLTKTSTLVRETHEPGLTRTVTCSRGERSFLDSSTKVSGVQDILTRMRNADIVIEDGDTVEDAEARALLNKFLGASVLMAGMQDYVSDQPHPKVHITQESVRSSSGGSHSQSARAEELDLENCWDEKLLRKLLDECTDYEQRRRLRARIRSLMAEQEACAAAVTEALGAAHITTEAESGGAGTDADAREEEEVTVTTSVRRNSSEKTTSSSTTKTSKVTQSVGRPAPQPVSPFAKFRQLEKQNSTNSPSSPVGGAASPQSPGSPQPYFKFTDPALQCSALTIKERLLQWCRDKTRDYENVKLENFSTSWADGLAFCALLHHFLPDAFDYSQLTPATRRHNFTLAFKVADEKAGIYPLLDVDDMVAMRKPDWKCVFTYVQSIYRRFKDEA